MIVGSVEWLACGKRASAKIVYEWRINNKLFSQGWITRDKSLPFSLWPEIAVSKAEVSPFSGNNVLIGKWGCNEEERLTDRSCSCVYKLWEPLTGKSPTHPLRSLTDIALQSTQTQTPTQPLHFTLN